MSLLCLFVVSPYFWAFALLCFACVLFRLVCVLAEEPKAMRGRPHRVINSVIEGVIADVIDGVIDGIIDAQTSNHIISIL